LAISDPDNALNYFIRENAVKALTPGKFYGHRIRPCMQFLRNGRIANVSIGALSPADPVMPGNAREFDPVVQSSNLVLTVSGLRLVGNCNISSSVNTGAFNIIRYRFPVGDYSASSYQYTGWAIAVFGAVERVAISVALRFGIEGAQSGYDGSEGTANYNHTWNNVLLVNNSLALATSTASPSGSGWKTIGPGIESIVGQIQSTTTYVDRNWTQFRIAPNSSGGFTGKFGLYDTHSSGTLRTAAFLRPQHLSAFGNDTPTTIIRVAGAGTLPSVSFAGIDPGEVGAYVDFDDLNMRVRAYKKGIDVVNAFTHEEDFTL